MNRISRLRARLAKAEEWADSAAESKSWQAAASLLKGAEAFDQALALLEAEEGAAAQAVSEDPRAALQALVDEIRAFPDSAREVVLAELRGEVH